MPRFEPLTIGELKRLSELGKRLMRAQAVMNDDAYWTFVNEIGGSFITGPEIRAKETDSALSYHDGQSTLPIEANELHIKRWAEVGYISLSPSSSRDFIQFLVTPKGMDYLTYRSKGKVYRWFVDAWYDLRVELRSALISLVVSVITTLITAFLLLKLGLK